MSGAAAFHGGRRRGRGPWGPAPFPSKWQWAFDVVLPHRTGGGRRTASGRPVAGRVRGGCPIRLRAPSVGRAGALRAVRCAGDSDRRAPVRRTALPVLCSDVGSSAMWGRVERRAGFRSFGRSRVKSCPRRALPGSRGGGMGGSVSRRSARWFGTGHPRCCTAAGLDGANAESRFAPASVRSDPPRMGPLGPPGPPGAARAACNTVGDPCAIASAEAPDAAAFRVHLGHRSADVAPGEPPVRRVPDRASAQQRDRIRLR